MCACRAQVTLSRQLDAVPSAFVRLVASDKQLRVHCKRLQHELGQTQDALSERRASLDERNGQMQRLLEKRSAAKKE